jgi:hypothetical protein
LLLVFVFISSSIVFPFNINAGTRAIGRTYAYALCPYGTVSIEWSEIARCKANHSILYYIHSL